MFIDFAGKKLEIINKQTGEIIPVEVFVAILTCSQYTYVQACLSQKSEEMISCYTGTLHFYSGSPKAIVSENLKSAANRSSKHEADVNRSFKDFAHHYNRLISIIFLGPL